MKLFTSHFLASSICVLMNLRCLFQKALKILCTPSHTSILKSLEAHGARTKYDEDPILIITKTDLENISCRFK